MTYYVYAFDLEKEDIAAALSFQDVKAAKLAHDSAFHYLKTKHDTDGFYFGYTTPPTKNDCFSVGSSAVNTKVRIVLPPWNGYRSERSVVIVIGVFEAAEQFTKTVLAENFSACDMLKNAIA